MIPFGEGFRLSPLTTFTDKADSGDNGPLVDQRFERFLNAWVVDIDLASLSFRRTSIEFFLFSLFCWRAPPPLLTEVLGFFLSSWLIMVGKGPLFGKSPRFTVIKVTLNLGILD